MENDSRYPYTYACDFLRGLAGYGEGGTKLSRADASQVRSGIAEALGMADDELARKLADYYKANQDALTKKSCEAFARSQAWPNVLADRREPIGEASSPKGDGRAAG